MRENAAERRGYLVNSRITGNPHLTRRWPFGRVTEGLPTIRQELSARNSERAPYWSSMSSRPVHPNRERIVQSREHTDLHG
jgi:hypothetical protein